MGIMTANINSYNIGLEGEVSEVLSHFNSDFIFDVIKDNICNRCNFFQISMTNIPSMFESQFKQTKLTYPENADSIDQVRTETYGQILSILSKNCNMTISSDISDLYSASYYLYDFLVSNFSNNLITFFANYIVKEKNSLYEALHLADYKKSKDSSTIYSKKLYKNSKIAIINSNLDYVIDNICVFDMPFYSILSTIYQDKNIVKYISEICAPMNDFFKHTYVPLIQSQYRPVLLTNIRLAIQGMSIDEDIDISNIK